MQTLTPRTQQDQPAYVISDADRARQQRVAAAWTAYNGELDEPLSKLAGQPNDNVLSNRCKAVVRRGASFLFGKEVDITTEENSPQEAQDVIDDTWGIKEARIPLLLKLFMNGAMSGLAVLRIVPDNKGAFRLVVVDPSTLFIQTAPQDCETVLLYCIEYSTTQQINGHPTAVTYREEMARIDPDGNACAGLPDDDDTWSIQHWSRIGDRGTWTLSGAPIVWPYSFPPLFHCQNMTLPNQVWGEPDITPDLIGLNNALNLVASCINRNGKLYAQPIIYATGTGQSAIDIKPGKIIGLPLPESKIVAVPLAADIANMIAFAHELRADGDEQTGVPSVATGRIDTLPRNTSGIALEIMFMPLLNKTEEKRCTYGKLIIEVSKALFVLSRLSGDIKISLSWSSPLPKDQLTDAQYAIALQSIGVSNDTLQRQLGYDPVEEAILMQAQKAENIANAQQAMGGPPAQPGQPPTAPGQPAPQAAQPASNPFMGSNHP